MSNLHPLFQSITDGFLSIPAKVAGASAPANVIEQSAQDQEDSVPYCERCGISHPADLAHPAGINAYRPSADEIERGERFDDKLAMYRNEY